MVTFSFDIDHFCCTVGGGFKKGQTTPNITIVQVKNDAGLKEEWKRRVQGRFRRQNGFAELVIIRHRVEERSKVSLKVTAQIELPLIGRGHVSQITPLNLISPLKFYQKLSLLLE